MSDQLFSGKYQVQREIASGGMGVVYLAVDQTLHREVAVKVLHGHLMGDPSFSRRFLREARTMARLNHENIIQIFAVEEDQDGHQIVMEYFPSTELKQLIREQVTLPLAQVLKYGIATTRALSYAHSKGVIHRDIKPGNILVNERDAIKLTDFGIAAALGDSSATMTGTIMGTPEYMSPEQARGDEGIGVGTDMYSLGVVLYEALTGTTPYKGMAGQTIVGKLAYDQQEVEWPFPSHVPPPLQYLIRRMTKKQVAERLTDTAMVLEALKSQLETLSSPESHTSITEEDDTVMVPDTEQTGATQHPSPPLGTNEETIALSSQDHPRETGERKGQEKTVAIPPKTPPPPKPRITPPTPSHSWLSRVGVPLPLLVTLVIVFVLGVGIWFFLIGPGPVSPEKQAAQIVADLQDTQKEFTNLDAKWKQQVNSLVEQVSTLVKPVSPVPPSGITPEEIDSLEDQLNSLKNQFNEERLTHKKTIEDFLENQLALMTEIENFMKQDVEKSLQTRVDQPLKDLLKRQERTSQDFKGDPSHWVMTISEAEKRLVQARQTVADREADQQESQRVQQALNKQVDSLVKTMTKVTKDWEGIHSTRQKEIEKLQGNLTTLQKQVKKLGDSSTTKSLTTIKNLDREFSSLQKAFNEGAATYSGKIKTLETTTKPLLQQRDQLARKVTGASPKERLIQAGKTLETVATRGQDFSGESQSEWATQVAGIPIQLEHAKGLIAVDKQERINKLKRQVNEVVAKMTHLKGQWEGLYSKRLKEYQMQETTLNRLNTTVGQWFSPTKPQVASSEIQDIGEKAVALQTQHEQGQVRYQQETKTLWNQTRPLLTEAEILARQSMDSDLKGRLVNATQDLDKTANKAKDYHTQSEVNWARQFATLLPNIDQAGKQLAILEKQQQKEAQKQLHAQAETVITKLGKMEEEWNRLLADQQKDVLRVESQLHPLQQTIEGWDPSKKSTTTATHIQDIKSQVLTLQTTTNKSQVTFQQNIQNLLKKSQPLLTEEKALIKQALDLGDKTRLVQTREQLEKKITETQAFESESGRKLTETFASLLPHIEQVSERIAIREKEQREETQRQLHSLVSDLTRNLENMNGKWETLLARQQEEILKSKAQLHPLQKTIEGWIESHTSKATTPQIQDIKSQVLKLQTIVNQSQSDFKQNIKNLQKETQPLLSQEQSINKQDLQSGSKSQLSLAKKNLEKQIEKTEAFESTSQKNWTTIFASLLPKIQLASEQAEILEQSQIEAKNKELEKAVQNAITTMNSLKRRWNNAFQDRKSEMDVAIMELDSLGSQVSTYLPNNTQALTMTMVQNFQKTFSTLQIRFEEQHTEFKSAIKKLDQETQTAFQREQMLFQQALGSAREERLKVSRQQLEEISKTTQAYSRQNQVTWASQTGVLSAKLDQAHQMVAARQEQKADQITQARTEATNLANQMVQEKDKLEILKMSQGAFVGSFQGELAHLQKEADALKASNGQENALSLIKDFNQKLASIESGFQRETKRHQQDFREYDRRIQDLSQRSKQLESSEIEQKLKDRLIHSRKNLEKMYQGLREKQDSETTAWGKKTATLRTQLANLEKKIAEDSNQDNQRRKALENMLAEFRQAFSNQDLSALQLSTDISPEKTDVLKGLFANWESFTVDTHIDSIESRSAKVLVRLHNMIDKRGKAAKPRLEKIIGHHELHIPAKGSQWGKPQW